MPTGVDQHLIEYLFHSPGRRRRGGPDLKPCYVVYHPGDRGFASLLHDELQARGVSCRLDPGGHGTPTAQTARARGVKVVLCEFLLTPGSGAGRHHRRRARQRAAARP